MILLVPFGQQIRDNQELHERINDGKPKHLQKQYSHKTTHVMLADSLLNALIAFSGELTWSDGVNLLYSRAAQLAVRPFDIGVVNSILDDIGLTRITKPDTLADLKRLLADKNVAFGKIGAGKETGRMVVFFSQGDQLKTFSDTYPYFTNRINSMWMGNKETVQNRILALSKEARGEQDYTAASLADEIPRAKETKYFHYFQPNPEAHNIGDCVVRAFCAVTNESWRSVMRQLAASLDNRNLDFNYDNNFLNLLLDKGFGRCYPVPKIDGRLIDGIELCDWLKQRYPKGNCKSFAFVGRSHVAGVLPHEADDGEIYYRFYDSWDSTSRTITDLFIKVDDPVLPTEMPKERLTCIALDTFLKHPQFGTGRVTNIPPYRNDALITVQFDAGTKSVLKSWALNNCFLPKKDSGQQKTKKSRSESFLLKSLYEEASHNDYKQFSNQSKKTKFRQSTGICNAQEQRTSIIIFNVGGVAVWS